MTVVIPPPAWPSPNIRLAATALSRLMLSHDERRQAPSLQRLPRAPRFIKAIFTDIAQEVIDRGHSVEVVPTFKAWVNIRQ